MSGIFITFEGGEGAGKSTLMKGVHQRFLDAGKIVLQTRAPGGTPFGEKIRSILLHEEKALNKKSELFLFLADRAHHVEEVIKPALLDGKVVLCDRYNDSTVAYQGVARELDSSFVRSLCSFATGNLEPDLTFYLDVDPLVGLERAERASGSKDRMESESLDFHQKIRKAFHAMARQEPSRIRQLDATLSSELILKEATELLHALFPSLWQ